MEKLLRRVFPTRPFLNSFLAIVALGVIIALGITAVQAAIGGKRVGKGKAFEGAWNLKKGGENDTSCVYGRKADYWVADSVNGGDVFDMGTGHVSECATEMPESKVCSATGPVGTCYGTANQIHYTDNTPDPLP